MAGGSASAVASDLCLAATASDTGGSVRGPASFCGLIGLRATHGRLSLEGAMPLATCFAPRLSSTGLKRVTHLSRLWRQTVIESP